VKLPGKWQQAPVGLLSADGRILVELKLRAQGLRDLHAGLMQLAVQLGEQPDIEHALLVVRIPRITLGRIQIA
jgi:hypothetical protein